MNSNSYFCSVCGATIKRQQKQTAAAQRTNNTAVCENDHICQSCCRLAVQSFRQSKANVALEMEVFEDTNQPLNGKCTNDRDNVCLMCKTSLSKRHSLVIIKQDPKELDQLIVNLISEALPPQTKISSEDKVCSKCWLKVKRSAMHLEQINKLEPKGFADGKQSEEIKSEPGSDQESDAMSDMEDHHSKEIEDHEDLIESECKDSHNSDDSSIDYGDNPDDPDFIECRTNNSPIPKKDKLLPEKNRLIPEKVQNEPEVSAEIVLPNYKRCSINSRTCVFQSCKNTERHRVPTRIREKMLRDYKFYIPIGTRVCRQHLHFSKWHDLSTLTKIQHKFQTKQIEDMFSMVQIKKSTDLDFNNVLNFDDYFIEYLLGIKREILASILTKEPKIKNMCNGLNGLLGLLMKHENGGPDVRIKSLLKISRTTLKRGMADVKKILMKSPVTKELGIEHLLKVK